MKKLLFSTIVVMIIVLSSCTQAGDADTILFNGKIITVDENFTIVQAVAISGDRIEMVGTDQEVLQLKGTNTHVINLHGKTVLPGLIDAHNHPSWNSFPTLMFHKFPAGHRDEWAGWQEYSDEKTNVVL